MTTQETPHDASGAQYRRLPPRWLPLGGGGYVTYAPLSAVSPPWGGMEGWWTHPPLQRRARSNLADQVTDNCLTVNYYCARALPPACARKREQPALSRPYGGQKAQGDGVARRLRLLGSSVPPAASRPLGHVCLLPHSEFDGVPKSAPTRWHCFPRWTESTRTKVEC